MLYLSRIIVASMLLNGCVSDSNQAAKYSVVDTLDNAENLNNETVTVGGFFVFEFENHNLYQSVTKSLSKER